MFARFCLYGFLKNQRYFEPFLVLALMDRGLTFLAIGGLIAIRSVTTNLLEVLSGALADTWGRRSSMLVALGAYIVSFVLLATGRTTLPLAAAMVLYGIGDAFRSGTHKAMILTWLRGQGRESEKTRVYGRTRGWSKLGSATSVVIGAVWVVATGDMDGLFWMALVPYVAGVVNMLGYPAELDGENAASFDPRRVFRHLIDAVKDTARSAPLRRLVAESAAFMGVFTSTKDYLQPVLQAAATGGLAVLLGSTFEDDPVRATALLVGPVYVVLFLASAFASRRADALVRRAGSPDAAAGRLWWTSATCFALALAGALVAGGEAMIILGFGGLYVTEALWRPVIVTRFDDRGPENRGATLLSIESQARSATTALLAPVIGAVIDATSAGGNAVWWPVGALGLGVGLAFAVLSARSNPGRG